MAIEQQDNLQTPESLSPVPLSPTPLLNGGMDGDLVVSDSGQAAAIAPSPSNLPPIWNRWWFLPVLWGSAVLMVGATGVASFYLLTRVPPAPSCEQLSFFASRKSRLQCVAKQAESGQLEDITAALNLVGDWAADDSLLIDAKPQVTRWSEQILAIAHRTLSEQGLEPAIAITQRVPANSPIYADVQRVVAAWKESWDKGEAAFQALQESIKTVDWAKIDARSAELRESRNPYWQLKAQKELLPKITKEKQIWVNLQKARDVAKEDTVEALGEALTLVKDISKQSYTWAKAEQDINRWSDRLLVLAGTFLETEDWDQMLAAVEKIPEDSAHQSQVQDLMGLARAHILVRENTFFSFLEARAAASRIAPKSVPYTQAKTSVTHWSRQIGEITHLYLAQAIASPPMIPTLELAAAQAQAIPISSPRRTQAQTFIAQWRKEIQRLEDQPYLTSAQQIAKANTPEALKQAIALASKVQLGRSLRLNAQTLVANWTNQLEIAADRPILDKARALAANGDLSGAVRMAEQITWDRALFDEAQAAIGDWYYQIQLKEDQFILAEARSSAANGSLSSAINRASQIGYGRPLYSEAQGAIAQWQAELNALYPPSQPEPSSNSQPYNSGYTDYSQDQYPQEEYYPPEEPSSDESYDYGTDQGNVSPSDAVIRAELSPDASSEVDDPNQTGDEVQAGDGNAPL